MLPSNASDWEKTNPPSTAGRPRRAGGLVVMFGLLVLLVAVIAVAVTRLPTGTPTRPSAATGAAPSTAGSQPTAVVPAAAGVPVDSATAQAIQKVVEGLDNAQAMAIATNDQTVMASTAMPGFYAEEVQNNQELVAGGVSDVKLLRLEWGDITSDGTTATATVWETWSTTFSDGTTEQARDRNVYTLVQDNGAWKVQADIHPDTPASASGQ